eukprot:6980254-Karenia_brevis.AAC.1
MRQKSKTPLPSQHDDKPRQSGRKVRAKVKAKRVKLKPKRRTGGKKGQVRMHDKRHQFRITAFATDKKDSAGV